jgi:hypothetical protein
MISGNLTSIMVRVSETTKKVHIALMGSDSYYKTLCMPRQRD